MAPGDPFTCPICLEATAGNAPTRRAARKRHALRHELTLAEIDALPPPEPPRDLVIPASPRARARRR